MFNKIMILPAYTHHLFIWLDLANFGVVTLQ